MWHTYNLVTKGDRVTTSTNRKVVSESSTGSVTSKRVRLNLTIQVEKVDFDSDSCLLRLSGKSIKENAYVRVGAYHTADLELNQTFSIEKDCWDAIHLERIEAASDPVKLADVAAVVMTTGLAHVCLVSSHMTVTKARIEINIPRRRPGSSDHKKAIEKFFEAVYQNILRHVSFTKIKCVLLGSPGYVKDDFWEYMNQASVRRDDRALIENKGKFVLCHANSGHKRAVEELFAQPGVAARLADTKAAAEVKALEGFFKMFKTDPDRAFYGYNHVKRANDSCAIDTLLVTDGLFRSTDLPTRKRYVELVELARNNGAKLFIFSTAHVSGEQLQQFSGIAAVLRFPMPDIEEEDTEEEQEQEEQQGVGEEGGVADMLGGLSKMALQGE
ncbi:unnamed protein product [Chrysoparadoxa australica]